MSRFTSPITDMVPNGFLLFFKSGTNSRLITYKDELESAGLENVEFVPVGPDGNVGNVFFTGSAKVKFLDQFFQQYAERDPVGGEKELGDFSLWDTVVTYDKNDFVEGSNEKFYKSLANGNQGNDPVTSPTEWKEIVFLGVYNVNVTYSTGDIVKTTDGNLWKSITSPNIGNDPASDEGDNWIPPFNSSWINKTGDFQLFAGKKYQVDGSALTSDGAMPTSISAGDELVLHNESISTNLVRIINPSFTIKGPFGSVSPGDNLEIDPGDTVHLVAKTSTILEVV